MHRPHKQRVGFIGLGAMGGPMARNLLVSGQRVLGYDTDQQQRDLFGESGGTVARTTEEVVGGCRTVFTSLPDSQTFVKVAERKMLRHARKNQVFVDVGTTSPAQTRRIGGEFSRRGASLVDAPVTGGVGGARSGTLRIFCGGELAAFMRVRPLLLVIGDPGHVVHCGPSGLGQIVKGVNQLAMGLVNAALLESAAYGVNAGVGPGLLADALGGDEGWRALFGDVCRKIEKDHGDQIGIKYDQYLMFLAEAYERHYRLPIAAAIHEFLKSSPRIVREANRMSPSFWQELAATTLRSKSTPVKRKPKRKRGSAKGGGRPRRRRAR